ncbi:MAG: glycosyltransferase family 8 protein [Planctomycetota bacterium]
MSLARTGCGVHEAGKAFDPQTLQVVLAGTRNMAMPMGVVMDTLLRHLDVSVSVRFTVLSLGFESVDRGRLSRVVGRYGERVSLRVVRVDDGPAGDLVGDRLSRLPALERLGLGAYLRLFAPELMPEEPRLLYLDTDLLVDVDVAPLWRLDLQGRVIAAARNLLYSTAGDPMALAYAIDELPLESDSAYFNSGVLVIDAERWRSESVTERVLEFLSAHASELISADQDGINAVLAGQILEMDPVWNLAVLDEGKARLLEGESRVQQERVLSSGLAESAVYHFWGKHKPWNSGLNHPQRSRYFEAVRESGYYGAWYGLYRRAADLGSLMDSVKRRLR